MYNLGMHQKDYEDKDLSHLSTLSRLEILIKTFSHINYTSLYDILIKTLSTELNNPVTEAVNIIREIDDNIVCYAKTVYKKDVEVGSYIYIKYPEEELNTVLYIVENADDETLSHIIYIDDAVLIMQAVMTRFLMDRGLYKKVDTDNYYKECEENTFEAHRRKVGFILFFAYIHTGLLFSRNAVYIIKLLKQLLAIGIITQYPSTGVSNTSTSRTSSFMTPLGNYHIYTNASKNYVGVVSTDDSPIDYGGIRLTAQRVRSCQIPLKEACYTFPSQLVILMESLRQ